MALFKSVSHKSLCNTFQPWHFITWFTNKISGKIRYIWLLFTRQETSIYQHRSKEKNPWWCSHHCYDEDVNISTCIWWIIMLNMLNINVFIYTLYNPGSRESRRDGNSWARVHTAGQWAGFKKNIMWWAAHGQAKVQSPGSRLGMGKSQQWLGGYGQKMAARADLSRAALLTP